jgi:gentisate 1,2-dioxygenase
MAARMVSEPTLPSHPVSDDYEYYVRQLEEERYWRQHVPQVIRPQDRQWQDTRNGRMLWFLHPQHPPLQTGMRMAEIYLQDIPPGGRSGQHRHVGEEVHFIIEGRGYEMIDGMRWDWEANDVVAIPVLSTHQSFNADPERPARFIAFKSRFYDYLSFAGIEHFEDAG